METTEQGTIQTFTRKEQVIAILRRKGYAKRTLEGSNISITISYTQACNIAWNLEVYSTAKVEAYLFVESNHLMIRIWDGKMMLF